MKNQQRKIKREKMRIGALSILNQAAIDRRSWGKFIAMLREVEVPPDFLTRADRAG